MLPKKRADALAAKLDIGLDVGVCHACFSFVSFELDGGTPARIAGAITRMAPDLWMDGLRDPAFAAVRRARKDGVPDADEALADLLERGPRSSTARAIVRRLAEDLNRRTRTELHVERAARPRLHLAPPEWN